MRALPMLALSLLPAAVAGAVIAAAPSKAAVQFTVCPSGVSGVATADTSCVFADSVRLAWYSQPGSTVFAYSPVTERFYTMQCASTWTNYWPEAKMCYGINAYGDPLVVYVD